MPTPITGTIETPPVDNQAALLSAMDAGIAVADGNQPPDAPEPVAAAEPAVDDVTPPEGATTPEVEAPPVDPATAPPAETPTTPEESPSAQFGDLPAGTKAETTERFNKMREGYDALHKEHAAVKTALDAAGIKDVAALPQIFERAKVAEDMIGMVTETGASPQQYGQALDYLSDITKFATKGDKAAGERAFATMQGELAVLAKALGKPVEGIHDPIAGHPDLQAAVESGEVSKKWALETAAARDREATESNRRAVNEQTNTAQTEQAQAVQFLRDFDADRRANDPQYAQKRPILDGLVQTIRETLPASKWKAATERAYASIQLPAAPPPPAPKPPPGPVRPNGPRPTMQPTYDDPLAAMDAGIEAVSRG